FAMFGCSCCCISSLVYLVGVVTILAKVIPYLRKLFVGKKPVELLEKNPKKDVVYLYQFPGTATSSSLSPFCVKVEAFCRLHNVKFERRNTFSARGANNLLPFIELNREHHADSQIILKRLTQIFKLEAYPDAESAAIGHAVDRMLCNHTFNLIMHARKPVLDKVISVMAASKVHSMLLPILAAIGARLWAGKMTQRIAASIGIFSDNEYEEMLKNDFTQLQTILGSKKFLVADDPTAVDCTAMGMFGSYYSIPSARTYPHELIDSAEFAVLKAYIE
ncbi:hypothetical protein PFISCL1PPCAC_4206, partial [Pristionchus fissidentatus]